jgi:hypothetical protein
MERGRLREKGRVKERGRQRKRGASRGNGPKTPEKQNGSEQVRYNTRSSKKKRAVMGDQKDVGRPIPLHLR